MKLYFGSNLKMYKGIEETVSYLTALQTLTRDISRERTELFILPSYTTLQAAAQATDATLIRLGAQNIAWEPEGQFTGEISVRMLEEMGLRMTMIGHSERRHVLHETDDEENRKVLRSLDSGFRTLLCIGETGREKEYGISREVLRTQLIIGLHGVQKEKLPLLMVAYEPVWSIGVGGTPASPDYAEEMHLVIRDCLSELFGDAAAEIPVLYGGSVNRENATQLIVRQSVDGLFVGRAAWDAENFNALIREAMAALEKRK